MNKLALHWKILLGMLLGVIVGLIMTNFDGGKEIVQDWIKGSVASVKNKHKV